MKLERLYFSVYSWVYKWRSSSTLKTKTFLQTEIHNHTQELKVKSGGCTHSWLNPPHSKTVAKNNLWVSFSTTKGLLQLWNFHNTVPIVWHHYLLFCQVLPFYFYYKLPNLILLLELVRGTEFVSSDETIICNIYHMYSEYLVRFFQQSEYNNIYLKQIHQNGKTLWIVALNSQKELMTLK